MIFVSLITVLVSNIKPPPTQKAEAALTQALPEAKVILSENFESGLSNGWVLVTQNTPTTKIITSSEQAYRGTKSLLLDYNDKGKYLWLKRDFNSVTNTVFRVFFYDTKDDSLGTLFEVKKPNSNEGTGLGVMTGIDPNHYIFRANNLAGMRKTDILRQKGWHTFEIIVTDKGTYAKIDNEVIYDGQRPMANLTQTFAANVNFVSTWDLTGKSYYDELMVVQAVRDSWDKEALVVLKDFYNIYGQTDFSPLYPELSRRNANDLRSLFDTATAFYLYGKYTANSPATQRAIQLFKDGLNNGKWEEDNEGKHWARGAYGGTLVTALNSMQKDLDETTKTKAKDTLYQFVNKYILLKDDFEINLATWQITYGNPQSSYPVINKGFGYNSPNSVKLDYKDAGTPIVMMQNIPYYPTSTSAKATISFYDNLDGSLGTIFEIKKPNSSEGTGIGVITTISPNNYVIRVNSFSGTKDAGIARSKGWHKFEMVVSNQRGASAYIDGKLIPTSNPTQTGIGSVYLVATWDLTGEAVYDGLLITRMPDSGYIGDTKGEENAWHADLLAQTINFFPDVPNRGILAELAKCYAYHSITTSKDTEYCLLKSQTVFDDFRVENHDVINPTYHTAILHFLSRGAMSYKKTGISIPSEFAHNIKPLYDKLLSAFVDLNSYQFVNSPKGDWTGANNTFYYSGVSSNLYTTQLGIDPKFSLEDYLAKRHIFYYQIASDYLKDPEKVISSFDQGNPTDPGHHWFLNTNIVGNVHAADLLLYSGLSF